MKKSTSTISLILRIATSLMVGLLPGAHGTYGSFFTGICLLVWLYFGGTALAGPWYLVFMGFFFLMALFVTHWALKRRVFGPKSDPGQIVIDEAMGMLVACYGAHMWPYVEIWAGFLAFRVFDILKPFPVNKAEKLPKALGVMADDVVAGIMALVLVQTGIFFWKYF